MSLQILPAFSRYPKEAEILGRLLAGYGDLEFELVLCLGECLDDDERALRTIFRIRGEDNRIKIATVLMSAPYEKLQLSEPLHQALRAMNCCKTVRNQFAHCHWYDTPESGLCFTRLETWSKDESQSFSDMEKIKIDVALLGRQE